MLRFLCTFAATSVIQKIDNGKIGRHREEYPMPKQMRIDPPKGFESEKTCHSNAPKTVVA